MPFRPRPKKRHEIRIGRGECIYVVEAGDAIKIGYSTNIAKRVEQLQTACAEHIKLVETWFDSRARQIECVAHEFLKPYRTSGKGEWFHITPLLAVDIINELFLQFPGNAVNRVEPKMLLVCTSCTHAGIVPYARVARFTCSNCQESRAIRFHAMPHHSQ
jgi:predicted RNA-binding Zn-ribbon protein involved in translation (DUF1610 family)